MSRLIRVCYQTVWTPVEIVKKHVVSQLFTCVTRGKIDLIFLCACKFHDSKSFYFEYVTYSVISLRVNSNK